MAKDKRQSETVIPGFLDADGRLFTKVKRPEWRRPDRVELVSGELHIWRSYSTSDATTGYLLASETNENAVRPPSDLLERFLALSTASGPQLHKFVQKYGPLEIFRQAGPPPNLDCWCEIELCEVWRYFAAVMGALLRIAEGVYSNSSGDPKDWGLIANYPGLIGRDRYAFFSSGAITPSAEEAWSAFASMSRPMTTRQARSQLNFYMNMLLALGRIRPYFTWASRSDQPQVLYAGSSLLSHLILQLCFRMATVDHHAFCDYCGKLYEPERAPRPDRRNFCPTCQENGIALRLADRKRREKERTRHRRHAAH
jgi:hypothetical protein